jgi:hypothetical protein
MITTTIINSGNEKPCLLNIFIKKPALTGIIRDIPAQCQQETAECAVAIFFAAPARFPAFIQEKSPIRGAPKKR